MTRTLLTAIFLTLFSQAALANVSELIKCSQLMPSEELQKGWKCSDGSIYDSIASLRPVAQCFKDVASEGTILDRLLIGQLAELGEKRLSELCDKNPEATYRDLVKKVKIEGAFGVKLGQKFDGDTIVATFDNGEKALGFKPENSHQSLKTYGVMVTSVSKTVYKIIAFTSQDNGRGQCNRHRDVIEVLLDKKYGEIKTKKDFMRDHIDYASGDREINLYCTYSGQLTLEYLDKDLAKLAIEETASTQDGSGF